MKSIKFFVPGIPAPGGSKKAFVIRSKSGGFRANVVDDAERNKPWRAVVSTMAHQAMNGAPPIVGPLRLDVRFEWPRPKGHFRKNGSLRDSAPQHRVEKPDRGKLLRAVEDALTGIVYVDDAQIVGGEVSKSYPLPGGSPGAYVTVTVIDDNIHGALL